MVFSSEEFIIFNLFKKALEYRHKLSDFQTTKLIKVAATPATVRKQKIIDSVKDMRFAEDQYLRSFGISVDTNMVQVKGESHFNFKMN